jgi:hypothetical protein
MPSPAGNDYSQLRTDYLTGLSEETVKGADEALKLLSRLGYGNHPVAADLAKISENNRWLRHNLP